MNNRYFEFIQIEGFGEDTESYRNIIKTVIIELGRIINDKYITYDFEYLANKIATLKVIRRDGVNHEYFSDLNVIFLSSCNKSFNEYSDEEIIIYLIHELVHFVNINDEYDTFYDNYPGFDEFFTEYLTYLIVKRIEGIRLESCYKKKVKGYFGNEIENDFIDQLQTKVGIEPLLDCYLNRDVAILSKTVGKPTLKAMNDYYNYYIKLATAINKPLIEIKYMLDNQQLEVQKQELDYYASVIMQNITLGEPLKVL